MITRTEPEAHAAAPDLALERLEIELLLEGIHRRYAFDFRDYAPASLRRRLWRRAQAERLPTLTALHDRVLHDPAVMERLLLDLSVTTTSMFRDPPFWRALREHVVPVLRTHPFVRIWSAGCSTGEEAYSIAMLLDEEGLLERSRIYATDVSEHVLERARSGLFPLARMREATQTYLQAGGTRVLGLLRRGLRRRTDPPVAHGQGDLGPAQPRIGLLVQRVPADPLSQRAHLLRQASAGPCARAHPRFPGAVRRPRARLEGIAQVHGA